MVQGSRFDYSSQSVGRDFHLQEVKSHVFFLAVDSEGMNSTFDLWFKCIFTLSLLRLLYSTLKKVS